ncbi:MAG: polymer-forming cytoskeletal protein [Dehalococcoidia bacterium]
MQLKKSPRETDYEATHRFEETDYSSENTNQLNDNSHPQSYEVRPNRPGTGAAEREGSGDGNLAAVRSESVIDRHSSFDGHFETQQDLRVEGTISGEVTCRGLFSVEREATARAKIQAHDAHIHGRVEGDIVCTGKLQLSSSAHVTGTLKAAVLVVEEGATVSGTVDTTNAPAAPRKSAPAAAAASEDAPAPREPATVTRSTRRDLPSFAIVSSDDRAASDRN